MLRALLATAIAATLAFPVAAQQPPAAAPVPEIATTVAPTTEKSLWCASAFYWLAASAEDSGDAEEAEMYDRWSKRLLDLAGAALTLEGLKPEEIETMVAGYDEKVLLDLAGDSPPHDVTSCPQLLGEFR